MAKEPHKCEHSRLKCRGAGRCRGNPTRGPGSSGRFGGRLGLRGFSVFASALQLPFGVLFGAALALAAASPRILRRSHGEQSLSWGASDCPGVSAAKQGIDVTFAVLLLG